VELGEQGGEDASLLHCLLLTVVSLKTIAAYTEIM
jgi:hypothetical protein